MGHKNIEIKAKVDDLDVIRTHLWSQNNVRHVGLDHQIDTYFTVAHGRLKLRQGDIENALIQYDRPDQAGPKRSNVILYPIENKEKSNKMRKMLSRSMGVLIEVVKDRDIYFIDNVKFHLDEVDMLGKFVEIEVIDYHGNLSESKMRLCCQSYMNLLEIKKENLIEHCYGDMIAQVQSVIVL